MVAAPAGPTATNGTTTVSTASSGQNGMKDHRKVIDLTKNKNGDTLDPRIAEEFEPVFALEYEKVPVSMVKHKKTGISICLAEVKSPLVNGYFSVHTEADDDYGCPHTLEHLIFMGSKKYPYKGILDLLANQCLAQGTNAWTDTDNTTYTIETAGAEGFLQIFPIYMDHLLFPTLTDSAFVTEIHHIDGEGVDSGVVYCEMQARENEMDDVLEYERRQMLFTDQNKSLKSETGGRLRELRDITNKQIQDYHKAYYAPNNICCIVCGQCELGDLCRVLLPVLDRYPLELLDPKNPANVLLKARPFSTPMEKLRTNQYKETVFPAEDDEAGGCVQISWFGPKWADFDGILACETLLSYFTKDSISPLRKRFSDPPEELQMEPLCATVGFGKLEVSETVFTLELENINLENLGLYLHSTTATSTSDGSKSKSPGTTNKIDEAVVKVFEEEVDNLDLQRLRSLLELGKRKHLQRLEGSPHDAYSDFLISEFLFGPSFDHHNDVDVEGNKKMTTNGTTSQEPGSVLLANMSKIERFDRLLAWTDEQWKQVLRSVFIDNQRVCLFGKPSKETAEKLQSDETKRLDAQKDQLGEEGKKQKADQLTQADAQNGIDPPKEVLATSIEPPDLRKVELIACKTEQLVAHRRGATPTARIQIDSIEGAQFCDIRLIFKLPEGRGELRELITIWRELAFQSPLKKSNLGPATTAEETVKLVTEVFNNSSCCPSQGKNSGSTWGAGPIGTDAIFFYAKVAKEDLVKGTKLLLRIKEDVVFTHEKVKLAISRILNVLPQEKRQGWSLCCLAGRALVYDDRSMQKVNSWPKILAQLKMFATGKDESGAGEDEDGSEDEEGGEEEEDDEAMPDAADNDDQGKNTSDSKNDKDFSPAPRTSDVTMEGTTPADEEMLPEVDEATKQAKIEEMIGGLGELQKALSTVAMHVGGDLAELLDKTTPQHKFFTEDLWTDLCSTRYTPLPTWTCLAIECDETKKSTLLQANDNEEQTASTTNTATNENSSPCGIVVYASSIESNYLRMQTACLSDLDHPDVCALLLACECFTMLEGPFWRKIRGRGLAYNYALGLSLDSGLLTFVLQKSTNPVPAFLEAKKIVEEAVGQHQNSTEMNTSKPEEVKDAAAATPLLDDDVVLNAARSGLTFDLIAGLSTIPAITSGSYLDTISRRGENKVQRMLARLMDVKKEDLKRVTKQYIAPLFGIVDTSSRTTSSVQKKRKANNPVVFSVSTPANKLEKTKTELQELNFRFLPFSVPEIETEYAKADGYAAIQERLQKL